MIPYGRQEISQDDIDAVTAVLRSDYLTQGPVVSQFENMLAAYCGAAHAVAANSATSALHLACLALGLGPGDLLWTTPVTFVASANCGLYCGANVDFVDIDPDTYNLSVEKLATKLEQAKLVGRLPKIVVPVHLCGNPCDMEGIHKLSQLYGFKVIEDASHAIGAKYQGQAVGNCRYSDITVFSFHPVKIITTAEGGVATTQSAELASKMRLFCSHGITRDPSQMSEAPHGPWYYQQIALGFNYRMTELQAALGMSQMSRLDAFVAKRNELARRYEEQFSDLTLSIPSTNPSAYSSFHLYVVRMGPETTASSHRATFEALRDRGIGVNLHYIPVHTQPFYAKMGFVEGDYPEAMRYYRTVISLPIYSGLTFSDQDQVIAAVRSVLQ